MIAKFFERIEYGGYTYSECCSLAGGSDAPEARELTTQELDLLESQDAQLQQLTDIAQEQFDISKEDRETYEAIFRDADTPEAQTAIADLQELMTGKRPTGKVTTDMLLRDVLIGSTGEMKKATEQFVVKQQADFDAYEGELTGLSKEFADTIKQVSTDYQADLAQTKADMGTIDQDILSREKGAAVGGISSAYAESRKQQSADLARRGLAGSGVESNVLQQSYAQEAQLKAQSTAQARMQALGLSDQQRMQKLGISEQQYGVGTQTAGQLFQGQSGVAGQLYGQQANLAQQGFGLNTAAYQQGIGNLQALNAAAQGTYIGAQNYLGQASSSTAQGAQIAGSTATSLGSNEIAYQQAQMQADSAFGAGVGSLAGSFLGTGGISSLWG